MERLNKAKDDKNVKAVALLLDESDVTPAQCEELRRAIDGIKSAGKEVYTHIDAVLTTHSLALAAGASRISATPTAIIMISGFNAEYALRSRPARCDRREARFPHLREVQERRRDIHA